MSERPKYLITGGAGFIGSHLTDRLIGDGAHVVVIDDFSTGCKANLKRALESGHVTVVSSKVSQCAELAGLLKACKAAFHLAAAVGVDLVMDSSISTIQNNVKETEVFLEAATEAKLPILIASTSEVYGKSSKPAFSEEDDLLIGPPHLSRWSYACSKLLDEFLGLGYARERGLEVVVCRIFNTVGPRQIGRYGMVLPRFIAAALAGEPLVVYGDGLQTRCFCCVDDTVESFVRLMRGGNSGQVFNVGNTYEINMLDLAARVIALLASKSVIQQIPYHEAHVPGFQDMMRRKPVIEKLEKATGFTPRISLDQIIHMTATWIESQPSKEPFSVRL